MAEAMGLQFQYMVGMSTIYGLIGLGVAGSVAYAAYGLSVSSVPTLSLGF
jgi:hypothetical protein